MKYIILTILLSTLISCQTKQAAPDLALQDAQGIQAEALPANTLKILDHKYFVVMYDTKYRLARYVVYDLTAEQIRKSRPGTRKDSFRQDPLLKGEPSVVRVTEYANSGYDKGHLANSADFTFEPEANRATFLMSNMVPQKPLLNQQAWRFLEDQVRLWACGEKKIKVITGPVLKAGLPTLKSGLPVPQEFFKIVLDETPPKKMLAFIYTQEDSEDVMAKREVNLKDLRQKVFPQMAKESFSSYPIVPISNWKSEDCSPKSKNKRIVGR
ncbi:DNA/RNA non-specific endonuclease [Bdellovibrio sp. HCB-162]|uniref:DNA/RNA non-specific endonuclease n=1 Tax=Bdellovibrio sp. HCB-162 TaxID=3394234 RepID=UPI0039BCFA76